MDIVNTARAVREQLPRIRWCTNSESWPAGNKITNSHQTVWQGEIHDKTNAIAIALACTTSTSHKTTQSNPVEFNVNFSRKPASRTGRLLADFFFLAVFRDLFIFYGSFGAENCGNSDESTNLDAFNCSLILIIKKHAYRRNTDESETAFREINIPAF